MNGRSSVTGSGAPGRAQALRLAWLLATVLWITIVVWAMKPFLPSAASVNAPQLAGVAFGALLKGRSLPALCVVAALLALAPPLGVLFCAHGVGRMARRGRLGAAAAERGGAGR